MKTMKLKALAAAIRNFLRPGLTPLPSLPASITVNGSAISPSDFIATMAQLVAAQIGGTGRQFATTAGTTLTLTSLQNLVQRLTAGAGVTVTLDYAYNIVAQLFNPFVGQTFEFVIATNASTTVSTPTLSDTAVSLVGTTTVLAAAARWYQVQVTQVVTTVGSAVTSGTTFSSLVQVGTTNAYTVTLSGNSISPVVGNAIYLNVTTGTLPPGWYPVVKVTSATSFIIVAPKAGTAWTATAATVPGTTTVPASQYTPGFAGVYSPLINVTGEFATVTATISV